MAPTSPSRNCSRWYSVTRDGCAPVGAKQAGGYYDLWEGGGGFSLRVAGAPEEVRPAAASTYWPPFHGAGAGAAFRRSAHSPHTNPELADLATNDNARMRVNFVFTETGQVAPLNVSSPGKTLG